MNKFEPKYKKNVDYNKYTTLSEWWKMVADNFEDLVSGVSGWTQSLLTFLDNTFQKSEAGKGLSTNDFTTAEKSKLGGIEAGAEKNVVDDVTLGGTSVVVDGVASIPLDSTPTSGSNNPVKSSGVYANLQGKVDKDGTKVLSDNNYSNSDKSKVADIIPYWKPNTDYYKNDIVKYFNSNGFWILKCTENHTSDDVPPWVPGSPWQTCIIDYAFNANHAINAETAEVAYKDVDGNQIKYAYAKSSDVYNKADKTNIVTVIENTKAIDNVQNNAMYEFTATPMVSITLAMSQDFWGTQGNIFGFSFTSGTEPTSLTLSAITSIRFKGDDCEDEGFTPAANKLYEVIINVGPRGQLWGAVDSRDYIPV